MLHYHPEFKVDYEVKPRMYDCLERLARHIDEMSKIDAQIESFKSKFEFFGSQVAPQALKTKTSLQWWKSYDDEHSRNYKDVQLEYWGCL